MTCSRIRDNLALYAGGDLVDARDVREVESHLGECGACRADLEALRRSVDALRESAVTDATLPADDPGYWHEVESKLRERALGVDQLRLGRAGWRSVPAVLAQAAMVLVVAGAAAWVLARQGEPAKPDRTPVTAKLDTLEPPVVVLVRAPDRYAGVDVTPLPAGGDVIYSDFNHVIRPGDAQRVRDQVMPVVYAGTDGPF